MPGPPANDPSALQDASAAHQQASATTSHPSAHQPNPTTAPNAAQGRLAPSAASSSAELASLKIGLRGALRQYPDFPSPGILFEDILPIFANPTLHESLLRALELHVQQTYGEAQKPDVIVGLEARGFLFGPSLALRIGAAFVPVRKKGKLPGPTETASYKKEYGEDFFQMQKDAIRAGQRVLVVDDIIATGTYFSFLNSRTHPLVSQILIVFGTTGGSAAAAGSLVKLLGGTLLGYIFMLELDFLKGREKLDAPVYTLLTGQEEGSSAP
jgi:adenine phosphoribosyltransferase